jgi:hypothetical protein
MLEYTGAGDGARLMMLVLHDDAKREYRKDTLPAVLHADHGPAFLLCFVVERLGEGADLAGRKPLCRTVGAVMSALCQKQTFALQ